jgi:serpin B
MKKKKISLSLVIFMVILPMGCKGVYSKSVSDKTGMSSQEEKTLIRKGNDFSLKLFQNIAENEQDKNVFISTIGMFYSLNIISNAASGATQQEICNALGVDTTAIKCINAFCRRQILSQALVTEDQFLGPTSYMRTAALFQAGSSIDINKSFQDMLEQYYFGRVVKGDLDDAVQQDINRWCNERTEGLINSFPIEKQDAQSANLLIANLFNGRWVQEFYKGYTKKEPFYNGTSATVDMMYETNKEEVFTYAAMKDFSLLSIPYVGDYTLYVILPEKKNGLSAVLKSLDGERLRNAIFMLKPYDIVHVKLPKFEVSYSFKASDYLVSLGISKVFSNSAELDGVQTKPMKISDITQKTRIILDEDGTRAGAITSASFITLSETMNPTEAYFYADHPFAYIIQDPFGNYCFMGTFWGYK